MCYCVCIFVYVLLDNTFHDVCHTSCGSLAGMNNSPMGPLRGTGPDGAVVMSSANRYCVRISVPAPTQSGVLKTQCVGVWPLHPLLSH